MSWGLQKHLGSNELASSALRAEKRLSFVSLKEVSYEKAEARTLTTPMAYAWLLGRLALAWSQVFGKPLVRAMSMQETCLWPNAASHSSHEAAHAASNSAEFVVVFVVINRHLLHD